MQSVDAELFWQIFNLKNRFFSFENFFRMEQGFDLPFSKYVVSLEHCLGAEEPTGEVVGVETGDAGVDVGRKRALHILLQ